MQRLISSCNRVPWMAEFDAELTSGSEYQMSLRMSSRRSASIPFVRASAAARHSKVCRSSACDPRETDRVSATRSASTVSGSRRGSGGDRSKAIIMNMHRSEGGEHHLDQDQVGG